jgi:membrane protein
MSTYAAALAYRGLLALFPFVIFLIALISVLQVDRLLDWLGDLARSGPPGQVPLPVKEWLIGQLRGRPGGAVLSVGALTATWATATGIRMLRRALHTAYGVPETRPVWKRIAFSVLVVPVFALAGIVAIGLLFVTSRTLMRGAGLMAMDVAFVAVWDWVRVPAALMLLTGMLSAVYKVAVGDHPPLRRLLPGAGLAAALSALVSVAFPWALATVLHYGVTYGSFSAAIVVLMYLYLLAAAVLLGAEVNATIDSRPTNAARDRA